MADSDKKFYLYITIGISIGNILSNMNAKTAGTVIFCIMSLALVVFNLKQYDQHKRLTDLAEVFGWFSMCLGNLAIRFWDRDIGLAFSIAGLVLVILGIVGEWRASRKRAS